MAKDTKKKKQKPRKDLGKEGSETKKAADKARQSKKKTEKVYLPAVIMKPPPEEEMCEHEIDYLDKLLAVKMEKLAAKGLSNNEIITALGISRDTFYRKLREEPYFSYCLYKHRGIAVANVESSLYKRATGFTVLEKTTEAKPVKGVDENGNQMLSYQLMTAKVVEKHIEPDTKAIELFLTNREPGEWKKKPEPAAAIIGDMSNMQFVIKRRE